MNAKKAEPGLRGFNDNRMNTKEQNRDNQEFRLVETLE